MWVEQISRLISQFVGAIDAVLSLPAQFIGFSSTRNSGALAACVVLVTLVALTLANALFEFREPWWGPDALTDLVARSDVGFFGSWVALLLLISINRLWSLNEQRRSEIADGFDETNADTLPDLRLVAFVSALLVPLVLPIVLFRSATYFCAEAEVNCLFQGTHNGIYPWMDFSIDLVLRVAGFFGAMDVYVPLATTDVQPVGAGLHLVMFARLVILFVFLSTPFELYRISAGMGRAVRSLGQQPDTAARMGRRITGSLLYELRKNTDLEPDLRSEAAEKNVRARHAAIALGVIADRRAITPLKLVVVKRKVHDRVRRRALDALLLIVDDMILRKPIGLSLRGLFVERQLCSLLNWVVEVRQTELDERRKEGRGSGGIVIEALVDLEKLLTTRERGSSARASNVVWLEDQGRDRALAA